MKFELLMIENKLWLLSERGKIHSQDIGKIVSFENS